MSQPRILIIDDEDGIRNSLSLILADEGYRVAAAENAEVLVLSVVFVSSGDDRESSQG